MFQVKIGSGSEGLLHAGDRVVSINGQDARRMTHAEAHNRIVGSGTSLQLGIARYGSPYT